MGLGKERRAEGEDREIGRVIGEEGEGEGRGEVIEGEEREGEEREGEEREGEESRTDQVELYGRMVGVWRGSASMHLRCVFRYLPCACLYLWQAQVNNHAGIDR